MSEPASVRAITRAIGGSPLARKAVSGELAEWYGAKLVGGDAWSAAADVVANEFESMPWLERLMPAFTSSGIAAGAALARLSDVSDRHGIVVTGGQQPGLFGGPLYVLHKALTLLEMADELSLVTGRPVAPVFWAATDDADFAEANHVSVVRRGRLETLAMQSSAPEGLSMARMPLGDLTAELEKLAEASGSAPAVGVLDLVRAAYSAGRSVGGAYLNLLRSLLEPLGVAVLDAAHECVRQAGHETVLRALDRAGSVAASLEARSKAIRNMKLRPQVADVPNLTLVFETMDDGTRRRVPVSDARRAAASVSATALGPNVLLRPVMERQILPTVAYVGGAGEIAYFAQVQAVAEALGVAPPRIVPRWSGTLMESHVERILDGLHATMDEFADPHAMEGRVAREGLSPELREALGDLRHAVATVSDRLQADAQTTGPLARSVGSMRAAVEHRLARLERRYAAAVKQAGSEALRNVELVRSTLYPRGEPQERVLSYIPFLARYGRDVTSAIRTQARDHVVHLINGD